MSAPVEALYDQELEAHFDLEVCALRDGVAVSQITHAGCTSPTPMCGPHINSIRTLVAADPDDVRLHAACGQHVAGKDLDIRPL